MQASALVIGPADGPGAALCDIARELGFLAVLPFSGLAAAETQAQATPLCFFLFAAVDDVASLKPVADSVRFSPSRRIRFSPMVYFSESPSEDTIRMCIEMGFDDVITMPFTLPRVERRLGRLIDRPQVYFESAGYLGPDRSGQRARGGQGTQFRRISIIRNPAAGVQVMRDEVHAAD